MDRKPKADMRRAADRRAAERRQSEMSYAGENRRVSERRSTLDRRPPQS